MKLAKAFVLIATVYIALCVPLHAHADTASGAFGVTITLRTFSEAVTADHRCIARSQGIDRAGAMRISCPATVDVHAIARASSEKTGQKQKMNGAAEPGSNQFAVLAGQSTQLTNPVELTISW